MILNSGRHTQPDPQSCRVRSLGGEEEPKKHATHQVTKPKLSSATPNRDTTIHCQRKHRKKHPPAMSQRNQHLTTPCCESLRQQHPNNSKQHGALAKFGNMQAGLETFNQQPCSGILPFRYTCKSIAFWQSCDIFRKKVTAAIPLSGHKHIGFLDSKKCPPQ